ncbi:MAG: hypothetical protein LBH99_03520, partial [Rickettsia sp.]|jgi:hypothetical protein|nr:hypothetical protein [Rickettsia sp.]
MLSSDSLLNKRLLKFAGYDFIPYFRTQQLQTVRSSLYFYIKKSLKEMITFFHQLDSMNLSFESIEDNLIIDRSQWNITFNAIHFYQNFKFQIEQFEDE